MKKKMKVLVILMTMVNLLFIKSNAYPVDKNKDLFESVLNKTDSQVVEFGLKTSFQVDGNGEEICVDILKDMGFYEKANINVLKNSEMYCLEFNKDDVSGYIESINFDNHNVVTVNISEKDSANGLKELKKRVENGIGDRGKKLKFFQFLKAKLPDSDISKVNNDVVKILRKDKAENIDTVKISNGYSTVAYTKNYELMKNNGKWMDFNFAVCSYSSGNYLIIGTPVITINY